MDRNLKILLIGIGIALVAKTYTMLKATLQILASFVPAVESFSSKPYWDVSRWSWGYGTRVPGSIDDESQEPPGTITRLEAFNAMVAHLNGDYNELAPKIKRPLKPQQWAAYLSFAYNEGTGNASNLVSDINAGNDTILEPHWKKYIYADHVVNDDLIARRAKEWALWIS